LKNSNFTFKNFLSLKDLKQGTLYFISTNINFFFQLLFIPIFLNYLGAEKYGLWVLIISISSFCRIFFSGLNHSAVKFLSFTKNEFIKKSYCSNILSLYFISFATFVFFYCIAIILNNIFPLIDKIGLVKIDLLLLGILFLFFKVTEEIILSICIGYGNVLFSTILSVFSKTMIFIVQIMLLVGQQEIYEIFLGSCITNFITTLILFYLINKKIGIFETYNLFILYNKNKILEIINYIKGIIISNISIIINQNIDKILVSKLVGLEILAFYNISFMIFNIIHSFFGSFFYFLLPKLSIIKIHKNNFNNIFYKLQFNVIFIGFFGILLIYLLDDIILKLWLANNFNLELSIYINYFLVVNFLILPSITVYYFTLSKKNTKIHAIVSLLNLVISILLMLILSYYLSVIGIIISKVSILFASIVGMIYLKRTYKN
tara:strand:- start:5380 stop:6675 length:1296 start_codon:yes stop_codon:yes gene_type:complete